MAASSSRAQQAPQSSSPPPPPYPFYLGGVAASIAACFTHPLDMVKTRMQNAAEKRSMLQVLAKTARKEGIQGLYVGLSASLSRQMSYSLVRFGAYDALKEMASKDLAPGKQLPAWKMGACASVAGAVGGVAGNWADVLLVRMTSDVLKPKEQRFGYSNALTGVVTMVRDEGFGSLFRGIAPNVVRAILMNASQLATYDVFKHALLSSGYYSEGTWLHFSASFCAGTVATTICSPADVIKARIMAAPTEGANGNGGSHSGGGGQGAGVVAKLRTSFRTEGVGFLFRGWTPAWARLSPNTILVFITLEKLRLLVDQSREARGLPSRRAYEAEKEQKRARGVAKSS
ncbi:unnamed protein product [Parajaminaea phylloscopi]